MCVCCLMVYLYVRTYGGVLSDGMFVRTYVSTDVWRCAVWWYVCMEVCCLVVYLGVDDSEVFIMDKVS